MIAVIADIARDRKSKIYHGDTEKNPSSSFVFPILILISVISVYQW